MPRTRAQTVDPPELRPGVPMEAEPTDGGQPEPSMQPGAEGHLRRKSLDRPTPVVGTAQPPRGLSGTLRRQAYEIPEHEARHWILLLLADRVDVVEGRVGSVLAAPFDRLGVRMGSTWVRRNPLVALGSLATLGTLAWGAARALRGVRGDDEWDDARNDC